MLLTLNQVISQITTLAAAHSQIAASGVGDFAEWQAEERNYPLLWVFHETTNVGNRELVYSIRLICADRVITGEEGEDTDGMEQEVLSDTLLILLDFLAYFQQQHSQTYTVVPSATIDPFTERFNDRVAGNSMVIQIRQPFTWDACQIPQSGATIPPSVDGLTLYDFCDQSVIDRLTADQVTCLQAELCTPCQPVTQQVNGTTIGTTVSGGTNNQLIRNTAGTAIGTAANPSVIANTTLRNSAAPTWTDVVVAGVTKTLAQGKALDTDGVTTLLANYIPAADGFMFTCTTAADATVEINGTLFDTVASGATIDIPVVNGGSNPVGSLQGSDWVIGNNATFINSVQVTDQEAEVDANISVELDGNPSGSWNAGTQTWEMTSAPCPPVPSLSVGLSNSTPNFGDAVTITVTPTGITPTNYTFRLPLRDGNRLSITQASNVYVWTTNFIGATTIEVSATDGVSTIIGSTVVTPTSVYLLDTYTTAHFAVSVRKLRSAYTGFCLNVRRSSDNTQLNIGFVNDLLDTASLIAFVGVGNGFQATWYDQSTTAGNATQATATIQPYVMTNGLVVKANGVPTIAFGAYYYNYLGLTLTSRTTKTIFTVFQKHGNPRQYVTLLGLASDYAVRVGGQTGGIYLETAGGNVSASSFDNLNVNQLTILFGTAGAARIRGNGTQVQTGTTSATVDVQRVGVNTGSTLRYMGGNISEIILFPDDQTANFATIETNQKLYFNIT